jgi:hypothetical protein
MASIKELFRGLLGSASPGTQIARQNPGVRNEL